MGLPRTSAGRRRGHDSLGLPLLSRVNEGANQALLDRFDMHAKNNELTTATMLLLRTNELNLVFPPGSSRGLECLAQAANPHSPRYQRSRSLLLWLLWLLSLSLSLSLSSSSSRRARSVT